MPTQVHVLHEHGAVHVSEAEPGTAGTGQHDSAVSAGDDSILLVALVAC